jgi:phage-related protein
VNASGSPLGFPAETTFTDPWPVTPTQTCAAINRHVKYILALSFHGRSACRWLASLGRELWEVRSSLMHGRIARVIFCQERERMVLLHGFIKKTRKTPQHDIDLALKRKKGEGP